MCAVAPSGTAAEKLAESSLPILQKPFKVNELLAAVDEMLLNKVNAAPIGG